MYDNAKKFLDEHTEIDQMISNNQTLIRLRKIMDDNQREMTVGDLGVIERELGDLYSKLYIHITALQDIVRSYCLDTRDLLIKVSQFYYITRGFVLLFVEQNEEECIHYWRDYVLVSLHNHELLT